MPQNYDKIVIEKAREILKKRHQEGAEPGGVYSVTVAHDDDCPRLSGGDCNCEPIAMMPKKYEPDEEETTS